MESEAANGGKYTLRTKSLMKRIESEKTRLEQKKREPKEKQKPPPLSKYRRKTANARERSRMREINEAFNTLQKTLPDLPGVDAEKLTKITVLRLAVNYIKVLSYVKDTDGNEINDIEDLRKFWCVKNAHMARPEHCVKPVYKEEKPCSNPISNTTAKSLKVLNSKTKLLKAKPALFKTCDNSKERNASGNKKKPSKSRSRGKVCKTASVATSNGAYITLKNVAFQCTPNRKGHLDNKPLMMSMTVKRPRLEHVSFKKPSKIARYNPPQVIPKRETMPLNNVNLSLPFKYNPFSYPYVENVRNMTNVAQINSTESTKDKYLSSFTICDIDSSFIRNDALELSTNSKLSSLHPIECPQLKEEILVPSSPHSPLPLSLTPTCNYSPESTHSPQAPSVSSYLSSDSECNGLTPSMELDCLLGSEPFEGELDHLTSLVGNDDSLSIFLDHQTSNFLCQDINSY